MASSQPAGLAVIEFRPELTGDFTGAPAAPDLHEFDGSDGADTPANASQQPAAEVVADAQSVADAESVATTSEVATGTAAGLGPSVIDPRGSSGRAQARPDAQHLWSLP